MLAFTKMHGLGNDFVVVDSRGVAASLDEVHYRAIGDRRRGVGYDQFLTIEPASNGADAFMRIHNPDGTEAGACGNGTRCVASVLMAETGKPSVTVETIAGSLVCEDAGDGLVSVDMGPAGLAWDKIPLAHEVDTLSVALDDAPYTGACCVDMGNPHAVFFVEDAEAIALADVGPVIEHHAMFPERTNVEFVQVLSPTQLRMRVWERSAGITQACGSGACATAVAAVRRGLAERETEVILDGGSLRLAWRDDGHVIMTGPVATSFAGEIDLSQIGR